jgi:hypothetical protein
MIAWLKPSIFTVLDALSIIAKGDSLLLIIATFKAKIEI